MKCFITVCAVFCLIQKNIQTNERGILITSVFDLLLDK